MLGARHLGPGQVSLCSLRPLHVASHASLGFPTAWLLPGSQTANVAEGFMDSVPETQAEASWLFYLILGGPAVSLLPLSIGYM